MLDEQTRRTVQAIEFSLASITDRLRDAPDTPHHSAEITEALRSRLSELPYVRALFVVGADGVIIQDSDVGTPNVNLADREYFKVHVNRPDVGLYVGSPLKSRSTQIGSPWFLSISLRITLADGAFYGVAVAAVEPRYFAQFYERISVGDAGIVALIHRSGLIISRYPDHESGVGVSLAGQRLFTEKLAQAGADTYSDVSKVDGVERLYAYRVIDPYALLVVVGLSKRVLFGDWTIQAFTICISAAVLVLLLIVGTLLILRHRARDLAFVEHLQNVERIDALGRITSTVAHDFNNLLTVIGGNLEIISGRLQGCGRQKKQLETALGAVERGERMIAQLLQVARRDPMVMREENICQQLDKMSELLRQIAHPCSIRFQIPDESLH